MFLLSATLENLSLERTLHRQLSFLPLPPFSLFLFEQAEAKTPSKNA